MSDPFFLKQDLYTYDGQRILAQGELVTPSVLDALEEHGRRRRRGPDVLLRETPLLRDMGRAMAEENYRAVFDRDSLVREVEEQVGAITVRPEVLKELEFLQLKDSYTYRHVLITTALTVRMVLDYYGDASTARLAAATALTHDFGKARIPLEILQCPRRLTCEEYTHIVEHPWIGFLLLTYYLGGSHSAHARVALNHHEKIDGSGYPRGVAVTDPIVQFVTINDMFDALISNRPYRLEAFNIRGALDFLCDEAELGRINMDGVKLLISYNRRGRPPIQSIEYSRDHLGYRPPDECNHYSRPEDYRAPRRTDASENADGPPHHGPSHQG